MSPDTAEMAIVDTAVVEAARERTPPFARPAAEPRRGWSDEIVRRWAALRADPARMAAVRDTWRALWVSRALVWVAGVGTLLAFGFGPVRNAFDPPGVTKGFGRLGDLLAAPAARWDASWYLVIAHYGYRPDLGAVTSSRTAFFPLYPLGLRAIADFGVQPVLAGVLLSTLALALALYGIHRLTLLELTRLRRSSATGSSPREVARLAVLLTAFAPMAFYFSAVYSESLYLALSVGVFWYARQGRWAVVALLGALAGATRSAGIVLVAPALLLYLYGPREDRPPDFAAADRRAFSDLLAGEFPAAGEGAGRSLHRLARGWGQAVTRLRPRYRLRRDVLWLALVPAGLCLYMAYLALSGGDALMPFHAQDVWGRHFAGPYLGVWDGIKAAWQGARQLLSFQRSHVYFTAAGGSPFVNAGHNLMLLAFAIAAVPLLVGVLRMLPLAYGVYVLAALALPLSYPDAPQPLMSLPRFLVVLFPLTMWSATWLANRPRLRRPAVAGSALLLGFFVAEFATWHWVA
jgi:hypothetical protein